MFTMSPGLMVETGALGPAGLFVMSTTDRGTNQLTNDYLTGYTLRVRWNKIETAAGVYDWTLIDEVMQRTQSRRQMVVIEILARDLPAYVLANLSQPTWADQRGFVTCVSWDSNAMAAWEAFVQVLADHLTPTSSGAGTVRLADHPALLSIDAPLVGMQSVRDVAQTLVVRGDYVRSTFIDSCVWAVQTIRDAFPDKYCFLGVFPMYDTGGTYRVDLDVVDAILDEFVPLGTADPKVGLFQELLSDAGPELDFMATPLMRAMSRTWVRLQALTSWTSPWTGSDKVSSGDVTVGLGWAYKLGVMDVELYAKDIQNALFQDGLSEWATILTDGEYPLEPETKPQITITEPDETELVSGTTAITTAVSASAGRTITKVEFFVNGSLVQTDIIAPYGYNWLTNTVSDGPCIIEARATDNIGDVSSAYRNCTVQNGTSAPYVDITSPDDNATVSGIVPIDVYTLDLIGVTSVDIYVGGVLKKHDTTSPYGYSWDSTSVANGAITITAIATDTDSYTTTANITVYVLN